MPGIARPTLEGRALSPRPDTRGVSVGGLSFARDVLSWLQGLFEAHDKSAVRDGRDLVRSRRHERHARAADRGPSTASSMCATRATSAAAALIRNTEIDIAVDLKGFTQDARPGILALRPAPVQVNYLGYPGTMGARYIDYLIADRRIVPDGHERHYSEKIVLSAGQLSGRMTENARSPDTRRRARGRGCRRPASSFARSTTASRSRPSCSTSGCGCSKRSREACCGCSTTMRPRCAI